MRLCFILINNYLVDSVVSLNAAIIAVDVFLTLALQAFARLEPLEYEV